MAVPRACIYHPVSLEARHLVGAVLRPERGPTEAGERDIARFEQAFANAVGSVHCTSFAFARSAWRTTLEALDLAPGSEVILPPITIPPMVEAVEALGLTPVFVDIDPDTLVFSVEAFRQAITPRTGAAMVTYLFGMAADPTPLVDACREHAVVLVEDFSHALGASVGDRQMGTFGRVGIYSCSTTKTLDAFGGGLAVTDDAELTARLRAVRDPLPYPPRARLAGKILLTMIWNVATQPAVWTVATFPMVRFLRFRNPDLELKLSGGRPPRTVTTGFGPAAFERFTARQARVGLRLLPRVPAVNRIRIAHADLLRTTLRHAGIAAPSGTPGGHHVYWQCVADMEDVATWQAELSKSGIDSAPTNLPLVYPSPPGPEGGGGFPVAARIKHHAVFLPVHPHVGRRALRRVAAVILREADRLARPRSA